MSLSAIGLACETSRCDYATRTLSGSMDEFNVRSTDLRFDIGFDSALAKRAGGFMVVFQKVCLDRRLQILQICKYSDSWFQNNTPRRVVLLFVL